MKFNNEPNKKHILSDGRVIWESRSVAVNGVIVATIKDKPGELYLLVAKRGPASADFQGQMNLISGYLDWNETGPQAFKRECWEEVGINFNIFYNHKKYKILKNDLLQPWTVSTLPNQNKQNVSLRYGVIFEIESVDDLPTFSLENNEVDGEVEDPQWLSYEEFKKAKIKWAFKHDRIITSYLNNAKYEGIINF